MSASTSSLSIDQLQSKVNQSVEAFKNGNKETDRLAAFHAAEDLVNALRKPQDAIYHLAYSVTYPAKSTNVGNVEHR